MNVLHPPAGAWYRSDGGGTVIGATNRSLGTAFGLLFFALFCVGPLGWKRAFDVSDVRDVRIGQNRNNNRQDTFVILLEMRNGKQMKLGSMLTNERRRFLLGALRQTVLR